MLKLLKKLKPYTGGILLVLLLVFLQSIADLQLPNFMSNIVNRGIPSGNTAYILRVGGMMLIVALLGALCTILASFLSSRISMRFGNGLREEMFCKVSGFSLREFDRVGCATLITRTTNDITQIQQVVIMTLRMVVAAPMMCVGGLIMALSKDKVLTLILLVVMPIVFFVIFIVSRFGIPLFKSMQKKVDRLNLVLRESLTGVRVIRAFNRTEHDKKRFDDANHDITKTAIRVNQIMAFMIPAMMFLLNLTTLAVMYFGAVRVDSGAMQIGNLIAVSQYIMQIMFALIMLSMMFVMLPRAAASAERINEVLAIAPTILDPDKLPCASQKHGEVVFENVSFYYEGAQTPAIDKISFHAKARQTTAIIGGTGSGKSTLVNLIPRFYDVSSGAIYVDGVDVKNYSQHVLRDKIGYTPQKALLFSGTVRENMQFGKKDATDEEILHACEVAQANFIHDLPGGLDYELAQGGTNLSGGQKQRLTIARALVRRPEIYIFDDNFSALDYKTDAVLRQALRCDTKDSTVIIVAQRVSTVRYADQIIVIDEGSIVGMGTHAELMENCTVYKEIVSSQLSKEESK